MRSLSMLLAAAAAGGILVLAPLAPAHARVDGGWWSGFDLKGLDGPVFALTSPGQDNRYFGLLAGGSFRTAGRDYLAGNLARWRGDWDFSPDLSYWSAFHPGGPWNGPVYALESWVDGSSTFVVVGGAFTASTGQPYNYIASYRENTIGDSLWGGMPGLEGPVAAITRDQAGNIVVGGFFDSAMPAGIHHVARWTGTGWDNMDAGLPGPVLALCTFGPDRIIAGGYLRDLPDHPERFYLAVWREGPDDWTYSGDYVNGPIFDLFEDHSGDVYVGGAFTEINGSPVDYIAVTDGLEIDPSPLVPAGTGPNGPVHDISCFEGHHDIGLLVGGEFAAWGDSVVHGVAGYYGHEGVWGPFGSGVSKAPLFNCVEAVISYTYEMLGPSLVAGGEFTMAGGYHSYFIGLWDEALPPGEVPPGAGRDLACALGPNYPNPFNPQTTIVYTLERATHVQLTVYDVEGKRVATLADGFQSEGEHLVSWDGRDGDGRLLAGGVYLTRLVTPEGTATGKAVIAR